MRSFLTGFSGQRSVVHENARKCTIQKNGLNWASQLRLVLIILALFCLGAAQWAGQTHRKTRGRP